MQQRAFLFDMDGVIVDSEREWAKKGGVSFQEKLYGKKIWEKLADTTGMTVEGEYEAAVKEGFTMDKNTFVAAYDTQALQVYKTAQIAEGLNNLIQQLKKWEYVVGIVSSSRRNWIDAALAKIPFRAAFDYVFSLDALGLPTKPSPEGYRYAMREVGASPETTVILEDSNAGIAAGKLSGAFTIAFKPFLVKGYKQISADAKAHSMEEVADIVRQHIS